MPSVTLRIDVKYFKKANRLKHNLEIGAQILFTAVTLMFGGAATGQFIQ
jgi:hypothetical protein